MTVIHARLGDDRFWHDAAGWQAVEPLIAEAVNDALSTLDLSMTYVPDLARAECAHLLAVFGDSMTVDYIEPLDDTDVPKIDY